MSPGDHKTFARLLKTCSLCYALYHPIEVEEIAPGCLGYFDEDGYWIRLERDLSAAADPLQPFPGNLSTKTFYPDLRPIISSSELHNVALSLGAKVEYIPHI